MKKLVLLPLLAVLLSACVSDRASYKIDGHNYGLTVIREQRFFWDKQLEMSIVAARLPDCQRRHKLPMTALGDTSIALYQTGSATFVIKLSGAMYLLETTTCEGFQKLSELPPNGLGDYLGDFKEDKEGKYRFVEAPPAPAPVVPAAPTVGVEAPAAASAEAVVPAAGAAGTTPPAAATSAPTGRP